MTECAVALNMIHNENDRQSKPFLLDNVVDSSLIYAPIGKGAPIDFMIF